VFVSILLLLAAGSAAAYELKTIILKPGRCVTVSKTKVCAAKQQRPKTVTITVAPPPPPPPPGPKTTFGDGEFRVGTDIAAGTYRATGGDDCYWARLSGFGGTLADIIANGIGVPQPIVTIEASDLGFTSSRCVSWSPG
jgi:hypothetical protein